MLDYAKYLNVYEFKEVLPGSNKPIRLKPFTAAQIKRLIAYNYTDPEDALDELLQSSVVDENFNVMDLYLEDRFYLLIALRKRTKGAKYNFMITCPKCSSQSMQLLNLDELKTKKLSAKVNKIVTLDDNLSVELDFITRRVQKEASTTLDKTLTDAGEMYDLMLRSHAMSVKKITTPEGEFSPSVEESYNFIVNLPEALYEKIRDWYTKNEFGTKFKYTVDCPHCDYKEENDVPLDSFLF